jgi:hypothetical protein
MTVVAIDNNLTTGRIRSLAEAAGTGGIDGMLASNEGSGERAAALRAAAVCDRLQIVDQLQAAAVPLTQLINGGIALHMKLANECSDDGPFGDCPILDTLDEKGRVR